MSKQKNELRGDFELFLTLAGKMDSEKVRKLYEEFVPTVENYVNSLIKIAQESGVSNEEIEKLRADLPLEARVRNIEDLLKAPSAKNNISAQAPKPELTGLQQKVQNCLVKEIGIEDEYCSAELVQYIAAKVKREENPDYWNIRSALVEFCLKPQPKLLFEVPKNFDRIKYQLTDACKQHECLLVGLDAMLVSAVFHSYATNKLTDNNELLLKLNSKLSEFLAELTNTGNYISGEKNMEWSDKKRPRIYDVVCGILDNPPPVGIKLSDKALRCKLMSTLQAHTMHQWNSEKSPVEKYTLVLLTQAINESFA
jgi:hypothetical protein